MTALLVLLLLGLEEFSCVPTSQPAAPRADREKTEALIACLQNPRKFPPDVAQDAQRKLAESSADSLVAIALGMDGQKLPVVNWLRSAGDQIVARELQAGRPLPLEPLEKLARDRQFSEHSRRIALRWCELGRPGTRDRFLRDQLDDPIFAAEAVESIDQLAAQEETAGRVDEAKRLLTSAFRATTDPDQAQRLAARLQEFDVDVNVHEHLGVLTKWHVIGPFAGQDQAGAKTVYPPEMKVDLQASSPGKEGDVKWQAAELSQGETFLDLRKLVGPVDDAVAYLTTRIQVPQPQEVVLLGGADDNLQVWVNGRQVIDAPEYYQRPRLEKHRASVSLPAGEVRILVKVCEVKSPPGASGGSPPRWQVALRLVDSQGHGVSFPTPE